MVMSGLEVLMIAKQPTVGVGNAVNPTILVPTLPGTFRAQEVTEQILDQGRRGIDAMDFRALEGVGYSEITWEGLVQQGELGPSDEKAVIGYLLANILGDGSPRTPDETVTDTSGRFDHRLIMGTTKEYLTLEHDPGGISGANDRRFASCRVSELSIRFNAGEGPVTYSVSLVGNMPTSVTAQTESTATVPRDPWRGFECTATVLMLQMQGLFQEK